MREEFEKWFDENMYLAGQCFCTESEKRRMLKAWTASRAAIECELPDPDMWGDEQSVQEYSEMTEQSLQAIGIRIKGKTE